MVDVEARLEVSISVVVPIHNNQETVAACLDSILAQSLPVHQLVIVDDGSSDDSAEIVSAYAERDQRVELVRLQGSGHGPAFARNRGIDRVTGEWTAFLDADDAWRPEHLATLVDVLAVNRGEGASSAVPIGLLFSSFEDVYPDRTVVRAMPGLAGWPFAKPIHFVDFLSAWIAGKDCPIWTGATCIRTETLRAVGMFPERCRRGEDKDLWLRLMRRSNALFQPRPTAFYRRDNALSVSATTAPVGIPCIIPTIEAVAAGSSPQTVRLLRRLRAEENYLYAYMCWRRNHAVKWSKYLQFPFEAPLLSIKIVLMGLLPRCALDWLRPRRRGAH